MMSVGDIVDGVITGVMPFGAFVDLGEKKSGLVHISEVSKTYVQDINDHVKKGDKVKVKVLKIDDNGKISLSMRQAEKSPSKKKEKSAPKAKENIRPDDFDWIRKSDADLSFEDKLSKFKQISDENMQAIRRNAESKRSGGYSRRGHY